MPFVEFQNHVWFSMFLVILLLITALFIIVIPKGTGACGELQILNFNFFIPQIGEFQTHSISNPSTSDIFCFWKYPDYLNSVNGTGPF